MKPINVVFIGSLTDVSGYGVAGRAYVRALRTLPNVNLATRNIKFDLGNYEPTEEESHELYDPLPFGAPDVVIHHTTPEFFYFPWSTFETRSAQERIDKTREVIDYQLPRNKDQHPYNKAINIALTHWETSLLPVPWVPAFNEMEHVVVSSTANAQCFGLSGVKAPTSIIPIPVPQDMDKFRALEPLKVRGVSPSAYDCIFYSICQVSPKKGLDKLLTCWYSAMGRTKALLLLKVYISAGFGSQNQTAIRDYLAHYRELTNVGRYAPVITITKSLSQEDMWRLHRLGNCYVLPSRAEGFSMTHFEAMAMGNPPIGVPWGGPADFLNEDNSFLIDYHMAPTIGMRRFGAPYLYTSQQAWAEPHEDSLVQNMNAAMTMYTEDPAAWEEKRRHGQETIKAFSTEKVAKQWDEVLKLVTS